MAPTAGMALITGGGWRDLCWFFLCLLCSQLYHTKQIILGDFKTWKCMTVGQLLSPSLNH